jgi:hypothetical protein
MHHEQAPTTATHVFELPDLDFGCNEAVGKCWHLRSHVLRRRSLLSFFVLGTSLGENVSFCSENKEGTEEDLDDGKNFYFLFGITLWGFSR